MIALSSRRALQTRAKPGPAIVWSRKRRRMDRRVGIPARSLLGKPPQQPSEHQTKPHIACSLWCLCYPEGNVLHTKNVLHAIGRPALADGNGAPSRENGQLVCTLIDIQPNSAAL